MTKPNTKFELDVNDIEQIESALRGQLASSTPEESYRINSLLGKIHHQKIWYRPKKKITFLVDKPRHFAYIIRVSKGDTQWN